MLKVFRAVSILEGISYLAILSVTFGFLGREWVSLLGMTHGILFTVYLVVSLKVSDVKGWSVLWWLLLVLASVVPFAFVLVEVYLRKIEQGNPQELEAAV